VSAPDRIWQRQLDGPFEVRAGTIVGPSTVEVVAPPPPAQPDSLSEAAQALADSAARLNDVPACMPLVGRTAIQGPRSAALGAARSVLAQVATHYSPDELRLAVLFPEAEMEAWRWARWLPHVQDASGRRLLGSNAALLKDLPTRALLVLADAALLPLVSSDAACLLVLSDTDALPPAVTTVLQVGADATGSLSTASGVQRVATVDTASSEVADRLARALAGRTVAPPSDAEGIVEVHLDGSRTMLQPRRV
jgi:DNA segregation ATPase FtsK/SpoIIIE-like protein